ncbi:MAG TPA: hypothetical protein VMU51_39615 [Mycobacteriales bacterium]|nr:hypothetical protein [Mycobacteriales bacterium]
MQEQRAFTAYLSPYTQAYKWTGGEELVGLTSKTDLNGGLSLLAAHGWELISATYRPMSNGDVVTGEYTLFCRRTATV